MNLTYSTFSVLCLVVIPIVLDVMPTSLPFVRAFSFVAFHWVNEWLHTNCICWIIFLEIHDIELYSNTFCNVTDWEKVPLWVIQGVVIEMHEQVILAFTFFCNLSKIPWLELWIEKDSLFCHFIDVKWLKWWLQIFHGKLRSHSSPENRILAEFVDMNFYKA